MTKELELLKELRSAIEKEKKELEWAIDDMAKDYARTRVDLIFGEVEEEKIPEAKVKKVALLLTGSIAKATLKSTEENLKELDEAIRELEEEMEAETETEAEDVELTEEDMVEVLKLMLGM